MTPTNMDPPPPLPLLAESADADVVVGLNVGASVGAAVGASVKHRMGPAASSLPAESMIGAQLGVCGERLSMKLFGRQQGGWLRFGVVLKKFVLIVVLIFALELTSTNSI
jgi:hypothetical protein